MASEAELHAEVMQLRHEKQSFLARQHELELSWEESQVAQAELQDKVEALQVVASAYLPRSAPQAVLV